MMTLIIPRKEAPVSGEGTVVIPQPAGAGGPPPNRQATSR